MNLSPYVGIPYLPGGRDHGGLDCYGLVRLVMLEQFHVELPEFITGPVSPRALWRALTRGAADMQALGRLVPADPAGATAGPLLAVSWHDGIAIHCGIRFGLRFLHTSAEAGYSVIERMDRYRARSGSMEFYQWPK